MIILHELCCLKTLDALQQGLGIRSRGADRQSPTLPIQICRQTEPDPHPIRDVRRRCCRCRPSSAQQQLNYCKYAGALGRRRPGGGQEAARCLCFVSTASKYVAEVSSQHRKCLMDCSENEHVGQVLCIALRIALLLQQT